MARTKRTKRRSRSRMTTGDEPLSLATQAQIAADQFNKDMRILFPKFLVNARPFMGSIAIGFANVEKTSDAPNGIIENATGFMRFMMHLTTGTGKPLPANAPVEIELLTWSNPGRILKFRQIKGDSPAQALDKLFTWFKKNKDIILSL